MPIYFLISNLSEEKQDKSKIISSVNQKSFTIEKSAGKIETTKKKVYNLQLTWIGAKRKQEVEVIEFISMHGQQGFEEEAEINPVELKIESDKIQNILEKKKNTWLYPGLKTYSFQAPWKTILEKYFWQQTINAKYSLVKGILYQIIAVINLNTVKNWNNHQHGKCKFPVSGW